MNDQKQELTSAQIEAELAGLTGVSDDQMRAIRARIGHEKVYYLSNTIASARAGLLPVPAAASGAAPASARETAGFVNPPHFHPSVIAHHRDAAVSTQPDGRKQRGWLESPNRRFKTYTPTHTNPPVIVKGHHETVLGHHLGEGAVDMWNEDGHKRPRQENLQHNRDYNRYHGLEERKASAKSGGKTKERYRTPTPTSSHPSHYDPTHPDYYGRNHWGFGHGASAGTAAATAATAPAPAPTHPIAMGAGGMATGTGGYGGWAPLPQPVATATPLYPAYHPQPPQSGATPMNSHGFGAPGPAPAASAFVHSAQSAFGPPAQVAPPANKTGPAGPADDEDHDMGT